MELHILTFSCLVACFSIGYGLECYTCSNERNNRHSCSRDKKQCDQFQDACTTYVRWGVPPYWVPHGERIYYISKDCDTRLGCDKRKDALMTHCKRDWYNDWACVECCTGDLCNYYVTLGSGTAKASIIAIITAVTAALYLQRHS